MSIRNPLSPPSGHVQRALPARRGWAEPAQENAENLQRLTRAPEWQERRSVQNQNLLLLALGDMGRGEREEGRGGHRGTSRLLNTPLPTRTYYNALVWRRREGPNGSPSQNFTVPHPHQPSTGLFLVFVSFNWMTSLMIKAWDIIAITPWSGEHLASHDT